MNNQTYYHNSFKLNADMISEDDEFANFAGLISTYSLNKYGYHMTRKSLTNFRNAINRTDDIKLFINHETRDLQIGKPYEAVLKQDGCYTKIGILKGLEDPNSDDVIKRIQKSIMTDFSIGHRGGTMTCDTCGSEMDGFFWLTCENGHVMGEEYEDKGKKKMWTATCDDTELTEVSVVGRGADPDAKIIKKLKEDLRDQKVSGNQLYVLSELYNLNMNRLCHQLGYDPDRYKRQYSIPTRRNKMPKEKDELDQEENLDNELDDEDKEARQQLRKELNELKAKNEELQSEMELMYTAEEYEAVQRQVTNLQAEVAEYEAKEAENADAIELGEAALEQARDYARRSYVAMRTGDESDDSSLQDDPEYTRIQRKINKRRDVDALYEDGHDWRHIANSRRPSGRQSKLETEPAPVKQSQAERKHKGLYNW